jgi:SulP family sulfate permease
MQQEFRGGLDAAVQGAATSIGPILLYLGVLGPVALAAGFWATLVTASVVHALHLLLRGQAQVIPSTRVASLAAYVALIVQFAFATNTTHTNGAGLSMDQLRMALAAASLMFLAASVLVMAAGFFRLGNLFKMIPTPVTAGVSNGTALILVWLALRQVSHSEWTAGITALAMLCAYLGWPWLQARLRAARLMPSVIPAVLLGLALAMQLEPAAQAVDAGLTGEPWHWISIGLWADLPQYDLGRMLMIGIPGTITLVLIMILESFTTSSTMQTRFGVRVSPNRELVVLGSCNLFSALLGGVPSTGSPVRSVANWMSGGRTWRSSVTCLSVTTLLVAGLGTWLLRLPAGVVAGLFLMQAKLMLDPVFFGRAREMLRLRRIRRDGQIDMGFWITLLISLVAFFGNLIWACFLGIGLSCLIVLRRVSGKLTARWAYLDQYSSRRVRSAGESHNLARMHQQVGVLRLTGHLFFGNSVRLMGLLDDLHAETRAVIIDVSQVTDVDPSAMDALQWLLKALIDRKKTLVLTGLKRTRSGELRQALADLPGAVYRPDLDRGLELCEDEVLMNSSILSARVMSVPLEHNALMRDLDTDEVTSVLLIGDVREVPAQSELFKRGAKSDGVWLLESGMVSIVSDESDSAGRLSTFGPGQFVGEMGFIDGQSRSATAHADTPVRALLLDQEAIETLWQQQPGAALKITRNIARELSSRVRHASAILMDDESVDSAHWANSSLSTFSRL